MIKDDTIRSPASRFSARSCRRHRQLAAGYLVDDAFDISNHSFLLYIDVMQLMGHKDMETTEIYLKQLQLENVPIERLDKVYGL